MRTKKYDYTLMQTNLESQKKAIKVLNAQFKEQFEAIGTFPFLEATIMGAGSGSNWSYFGNHMKCLFQDLVFEKNDDLLRKVQ